MTLEEAKLDSIKQLMEFKDYKTFPWASFIEGILKAKTIQELGDIGMGLDTWRYGF